MVEINKIEDLKGVVIKTIGELRADLFYQIESKFGPEKASKYPSIVKADEVIESLTISIVKSCENCKFSDECRYKGMMPDSQKTCKFYINS